MEAVRVDICYRPLRIAWAIDSHDVDSLRRAVRLTNTLWGGRFNPIVFADKPKEAEDIVELFRADLIFAVGDSAEVKGFPDRFPHLRRPFLLDALFQGDPVRAYVLDIHNAFSHWQDTPQWEGLKKIGIRRFVWDDDDALSDAFLMQYGSYPDASEIGIDYTSIFSQGASPKDHHFEKTEPIPLDALEHPSLAYLTRHGLSRHYSVHPGWDYPGFYVGDARNVEDLVQFWNLRAADIGLQFLDPTHIDRYAAIRPTYERDTVARLAKLDEHERSIAVWSRADTIDQAVKLFGGEPITACRVSSSFWNGGTVRAPMMIFGEASSLGVVGREGGKPKISFALNDKPFCADTWFYSQHLVASVALYGGEEQHIFHPPHVPEWNEFFARHMHFDVDRLRIEPERMGIIVDATEYDTSVSALPISALAERTFESIGASAKLSNGGLITQQLILRLGGLHETRVFKIPGVRRLLKTYGPRDTFTKRTALQLIGGKDPDNPQANFADHKTLFIEPRAHRTDLTAEMVFRYLVKKGLFRLGAELVCPNCNLTYWIALDTLKQESTCELCGATFDATGQLVDGVFHYRRTGILGVERNMQGSIPVVLAVQQLHRNLRNIGRGAIYFPSYDLVPTAGGRLRTCEVDFSMILTRVFPNKSEVVIGECKDEGGTIDLVDVENLQCIADLLPAQRFQAYIVFAKLAPFTLAEIALAKTLNGPHQQRVILLTPRELEPQDILERITKELGIKSQRRTLEELANLTHRIYFAQPPASTSATSA